MTILLPSPDQLRRTGSLKWTGIQTSDGRPTLGAWVAEMDFATAPPVADAMKRAIDDGLLGYQPTWLPERVAESLAEFQRRRFGWDLDPDHVRLVASVLPALNATMDHLIRPGSPVIVPTPAYMPFLTLPEQHGHPVIQVPSLRERGWSLDLDGIRAGLEQGAGLVVLCDPWNPTGRVLSEQELRDLHDLVSGYDALVFADEIHSPLGLDDPGAFLSYARVAPEHTVTATAASKGWNIAGLPCGQVILPDDALRERWDRAVGTGIAHEASTLGALGTIAAFAEGDAWQSEVREVLIGNIDRAVSAVAGTGIDLVRPQATYLTWWGFERAGLPGGAAPATLLRDKAGIAANDGSTLGADYAQWARLNLACSPAVADQIVEGVLGLVASH